MQCQVDKSSYIIVLLLPRFVMIIFEKNFGKQKQRQLKFGGYFIIKSV